MCNKRETRCSFLIKQGVHRIGMWMFECSCGASTGIFDCSRLLTLFMIKSFVLDQPS